MRVKKSKIWLTMCLVLLSITLWCSIAFASGYWLDDNGLQSAINAGKTSSDGIQNLMLIYKLPLVSYNIPNHLLPDVSINTPYKTAAMISYNRYNVYQDCPLAEVKKFNELFALYQVFDLNIYGNSIDFGQYSSVILQQGDQIIYPSQIVGLDGLADMSECWPDAPAYKRSIDVYFPADQVDTYQKATLIYLNGSRESSASYEVDFSKYR